VLVVWFVKFCPVEGRYPLADGVWLTIPDEVYEEDDELLVFCRPTKEEEELVSTLIVLVVVAVVADPRNVVDVLEGRE
jgi:hypothetical protein